MTHSVCHFFISIAKSLATQGAGYAGVLEIFRESEGKRPERSSPPSTLSPLDFLLKINALPQPLAFHPYTKICPSAPGTDVQSSMREQCKSARVTPHQMMERNVLPGYQDRLKHGSDRLLYLLELSFPEEKKSWLEVFNLKKNCNHHYLSLPSPPPPPPLSHACKAIVYMKSTIQVLLIKSLVNS